jgi:hypothetical protein
MIIFLTLFYIPYSDIDSALTSLNLNREAISFSKLDWIDSELILPRVRELMDNPLKGEEYSNKIINAINSNIKDLIITASRDLEINLIKQEFSINSIRELISVLNDINKLRNEAFSNLTRRDKIILLSKLPGRWENEEDSTDDWLRSSLLERYNIKFDTTHINEDTIMNIFKKMDLEKLIQCGYFLYLTSEEAINLINSIPDDSLGRSFETKQGRIIIGSKKADFYNGGESFILDPGGDDVYVNAGGAIGILDSTSTLKIIVDLNGNDIYRGDEIISFGAALGGCAVLIDLEGNDYYNCSHYSMGSGYMGFGLLVDKSGDDFYNGGIFSIGAGNFGIGIHLDFNGDDSYRCASYGEGFGSTYGYGILSDCNGNDIYYAGGKYFHTPLQPKSYQSLSQGFAMGIRPNYGGGIGFLYDGGGNDFYNGDIYAQGSSYWCGAGFLIDKNGQDRYIATEYAQGAGIHFSYGYLADLEGNDHYFSHFGPSLGEGHDFSCGILIDMKGDDWYSVSGGLGIGLNNSFGLFSDLSGNDVYNIKENLGIGDVNLGRGFYGIGLFLDLGGKDIYPEERGANNLSWINNYFGIGIDRKSEIEEKIITQRPIPIFSKMNIEELFEIASEWGVGNNKDRVKEAREYLSKKGKAALDYIFNYKIETENGLELRAIEFVLKENKDSIVHYIKSNINNSKEDVRKNVFYFIGKLEIKSFSDSLLIALKRENKEEILRYIVYALGKLKEKRAVSELIEFLDRDEPLKISSIKSLGEIGDTSSINPILDKLDSPYVTVKSSILKSLISYDTLLYPYIEKRLKKDFHPEILLLSAEIVKKDTNNYRRKVKRLLFNYLESSDWKNREFSARALSILGGVDVEEKFRIKIPSEPNPLVRGIFVRFLNKIKK